MPNTQTELEKELEQQGLLNKQTAPASQKKAEEEQFVNPRVERDFKIEANPYFQLIVKNKELTAQQKRDKVEEMMTFQTPKGDEDPAEVEAANKARLEDFESFKQWLMSERKRMAQDIIDLTDPKTFANLSRMYEEINEAMIGYQDRMRPLQETVDAIHTLLNAGDQELVLKIYKSYAEDDLAKANYDKAVKQAEAELRANMDQSKRNDLRIRALRQDTGLFGKLKKRARVELSQLEPNQAELELKIKGYAKEDGTVVGGQAEAYKTLLANPPKEQYPEYKNAKDRVRELKDLSGPEWEKRVTDLIADAQNFINTTDVRGTEVLEHHTQARQHIDILDKANEGLQGIYALMGDSTKRAAVSNQEVYDALKTAPKDEEYMDKVKRERLLKAASLFINESNSTATDTVKVGGELDQQAVTLTTFREDNIQQTRDARDLIGSTNARTSEGIATALFSVTAAATEQARIIAANTNDLMQDANDRTVKGEIKRLADQQNALAAQVNKASERMSSLMQVTEEARKSAEAGYASTKQAVSGYEQKGKLLKESLRKLQGASAEVDMQSDRQGAFNDNAKPDAAAPAPAPKAAEKKGPGGKPFSSPLTDMNL